MEPRFFNRELSWIEFNARVLHQGLRKELPLMERLQFLSIVTSNFDEFFQVRVASVKRMMAESPDAVDISGLTPEMVLHQISARAHQVIRAQHDCLKNDILPALAAKNLVYVKPDDFPTSRMTTRRIYFATRFFRSLRRSARTQKFSRTSITLRFMRHSS